MDKADIRQVVTWRVAKADKTIEVVLSVTAAKNGKEVVDLALSFWVADLPKKGWDGDEKSLWVARQSTEYLSDIGGWLGHLNFDTENEFEAFVLAVFGAAELSLWSGEPSETIKTTPRWRIRTRLMMNCIINRAPEFVTIHKNVIDCQGLRFFNIDCADHAEAVGALVMYAVKNGRMGKMPNGAKCSRSEFREKVHATGQTQAALAARLGITERGLRMILADESAETKTNHNYCQQFAVEALDPWLRFEHNHSPD